MDKYNTLWRRFWAGILDSFILLPITWGIKFFFLFVSTMPLMIAFSSILVGVVSVGYYIFMHNRYGQTLGKMAAKVKVLDVSETPINFGQAIMRSLPQIIPIMYSISFSTADYSAGSAAKLGLQLLYGSLLVFYLADIIVCLASPKRRALHDFIAGTIVVRTDA